MNNQPMDGAFSSCGIDKLIEQHTGMTARQDERAHADLRRLAYAVMAADIPQVEQPFAIVRGYHPGSDLPALACFNGSEYEFSDGDQYGREGDTLAGFPAEFLTQFQLEQKIAAALDNFGRVFPLLTMDPRTLRAALREAWMAGRVDLGAVHWSSAEKYATKALTHWSQSSATLDWCPECHARDSDVIQTPDPLGDPGEKADWLSTILHRLPCVPQSAGMTPEQFRLFKMGFHRAMHEAGKIAKQYVDPRLMAADRACARADRIIAELMGLDAESGSAERDRA